MPLEENYNFRNFVFNITNVDTSGTLTTGVSSGGSPPDYYNLSTPTFLFDSGLTVYQSTVGNEFGPMGFVMINPLIMMQPWKRRSCQWHTSWLRQHNCLPGNRRIQLVLDCPLYFNQYRGKQR